MNSKFNVIHQHFLKAIAKYCNSNLSFNFSEDINLFFEDVYSYILKQNNFDIKNTRTYFFKTKNIKYLSKIMDDLDFNENQIITVFNSFFSSVEKDFYNCKKNYNINEF